MASFSGLGMGLSFLFGCVLLGLVGELYYLLWWKKRYNRRREREEMREDQYNDNTHYTPDLPYLSSCWKIPKTNSVNTTTKTLEEGKSCSDNQEHEQEPEMGLGKDLLLRGLGEESVECELMRLHNLCGPPRFLFTINEETREDLESEDQRSRKGSRTKSLSDLNGALDHTPFLSPLSSPPLKPPQSLDSYYHHGININPLFESSSPPPTFKFLRDAEEKLLRRLMEEAEKRAQKKEGYFGQDCFKKEEREGSFVKLVVGKEGEIHHHISQNPSQVLPLASSPSSTAIRPIDHQK